MPLSEDYTRWLDDPMTRTVFRALERAETAQKAQWDAASWQGGMVRADELKDLLNELRVRADCYRALRELTWPDVAQWLGIDDDT